MDPANTSAVRLPSYPVIERTALTTFTQPVSWTVQASVAGQGSRGLLMRQAAYPLWLESSGVFGYSVKFDDSAGSADYFTLPKTGDQVALTETPDAGYTTSYTSTKNMSVNFAPGNTLSHPILGQDTGTGSAPFFYLPAAAKIGFYVSDEALVGAGTWEVSFEQWTEPGIVADAGVLSLVSAGGFGTIGGSAQLLGENAWVRATALRNLTLTSGVIPINNVGFTIVVSSGVQTLTNVSGAWNSYVTCATTSVTALMPAFPPPEYSVSSAPYYSSRVTGVSASFANVTKVMNKEGAVLSGHLAPTSKNVWWLNDVTVSAIHPSEKAYTPLDAGYYTYVPPSNDTSAFLDYTSGIATTIGGSPIKAPLFRLDNSSGVNYFSLSDPDGGTTMAITVSWAVEFRTSSTLFQIAVSSTPLETYQRAIVECLTHGFFWPFSDPSRLKLISAKSAPIRPTTLRGAGWTSRPPQRKQRQNKAPKQKPQAQPPRKAPKQIAPLSRKLQSEMQAFLRKKGYK